MEEIRRRGEELRRRRVEEEGRGPGEVGTRGEHRRGREV